MRKTLPFWKKSKPAPAQPFAGTAEEAQIEAKRLNEGLRVLSNIQHMVHSFDARGPQAWGAANEADRYLEGLKTQTKGKLEALAELLPKATEAVDEKPAV